MPCYHILRNQESPRTIPAKPGIPPVPFLRKQESIRGSTAIDSCVIECPVTNPAKSGIPPYHPAKPGIPPYHSCESRNPYVAVPPQIPVDLSSNALLPILRNQESPRTIPAKAGIHTWWYRHRFLSHRMPCYQSCEIWDPPVPFLRKQESIRGSIARFLCHRMPCYHSCESRNPYMQYR